MELDLLQVLGGFGAGLVFGILAMIVFNKVRSGSVSAGGVKQDFDQYKSQVEEHFEQTSKKFQDMTEQYQDLYEHLAVGATTLCRPDSVAAGLADGSDSVKPKQIEAKEVVDENVESETDQADNDDSTAAETSSETNTESEAGNAEANAKDSDAASSETDKDEK